MPVVIEVTTDVAAPPSVVFDLELDVDVHAASMAGSDERAGTSSGSRRLQAGDEVTFDARHLGVRWRMTSRITAYERPHRFVDEQVRGPFAVLHHEHRFEPRAGGTRMTDRMTVALPGGPPGALLTRCLAGPYLRRLLLRRAQHVRGLAEGSSAGGAAGSSRPTPP